MRRLFFSRQLTSASAACQSVPCSGVALSSILRELLTATTCAATFSRSRRYAVCSQEELHAFRSTESEERLTAAEPGRQDWPPTPNLCMNLTHQRLANEPYTKQTHCNGWGLHFSSARSDLITNVEVCEAVQFDV